MRLRRPEQALRVAEPALVACVRQRLSGPVLFEGRRIAPLLRLAIDHGVQTQVARDLAEQLRQPATAMLVVPETGARLTARETQILGLLGAGLSNPKIAERLTIGDETVKTHVTRVLHKLGVPSRAAAAVRAHELGVPDVPAGRHMCRVDALAIGLSRRRQKGFRPGLRRRTGVGSWCRSGPR